MPHQNRKAPSLSTTWVVKKIQTDLKIAVDLFLKKITDYDGVIELSSLKKIAGGGTHDVFQFQKHPQLLLKIMKHTVGKDKDELSIHLQFHEDQCKTLYETFNPARCIIENRSIRLIKTTPSNDKPQIAIVSVVPFDSCFESKEKFGFNVKPVELDPLLIQSKRDLYQRANEVLLGKKTKDDDVIRNYPLLDEQFKKIFALLETDSNLVDTMQEFLISYKKFYKRSGALLDTIGTDNILFYKSENGWQFKLGSVIKHDTGLLTKRTLEAIKKNPGIVNQSFEYFTPIYFMPACIRALNACAKKIDMEKVIDDITVDSHTIDILATMHEQRGKSLLIVNHAEHQQFIKALELFHQYELEEKQHDTALRDMLGTHYWKHLKEGGKPTSLEEIKSYLNLLCDPKNQFPDFRKESVTEGITGLNDVVKMMEEKTDHHLISANEQLESTCIVKNTHK